MTIRLRTVSKIAALFFVTTLTLGTVSAVSWNNPSEGEVFATNSITLNVSESTASYVDFWIKTSSETNFTHVDNVTSPDSGTNFYTYSLTSYGDGTYDIRANNSNGEATQSSVIFDTQEPNLDSNSPTGSISDTSPKVSVEVSDSGDAGVDYTYLNVSNSEGDVESVKGTSLDLSSLSEGKYTVDYQIVDQAGNTKSGSWNFTVDTSYNGDTQPELEWSSTVNDKIVRMEDDVTLTLTYGNQDDENPSSVTCYDGSVDSDNKVGSDSSRNQNDNDNYEFSCDFDADDFTDGQEVDLKIEVCDQAGNCKTYDAGSYTFDKNAPQLESLSMPASAVNSDFDASYEASDSSGIAALEYFFDANVDEGQGNSVEVNSDSDSVDSSFTVDTSGLKSGENKIVYVRVKDSAGRWSSVKQLEFDYFPGATPELSLKVPSKINATATKQSTFDVTVQNTGKIPASGIEISVSGLMSGKKEVKELLPGNSKTVSFSFTPEKSDIGNRKIEVTSGAFNVSSTVEVRVLASKSQQESITSKLETYSSKLEKLKANTTDLSSKLNDKLKTRLRSNVSSFETKIQNARQAVDAGKYFKAQEILSNVDTAYSSAKSSYEKVKSIHQKNKKQTMIMIGVSSVLLLLLAGGAFAYHEGMLDDYDLGMDGDLDLDDLKHKLGDFGGSGSDEDSEDEFAWDGFD